MGRIRLLPPEVAELIAAGEVVERPASAVKELCENALDAHARRIDVELEDGGSALVAVTDDGEGMAADDAQLAFQRHATSKIRSLDDLAALRTLGFRGEALPSLASVARVRLVTRRTADEGGLQLMPGEPSGPCAAAPGTRVEVCDLFHNVPARRKALRSAQAELAACVEVVSALALCRPDVAFSLRHTARRSGPEPGETGTAAPARGRELLRTHGSGTLEDAVLALWGQDAAAALLPVRAVDGGVAVRGVACQPSAARANRGRQVFCVNGRPVRSDVLRGATEAAFRGLLMVHRYPAAVLAVDCDPAAVDVNVHPSKLEVRFADGEAVRRLVFQAVRAALQRTRLIPELPLARPERRAPSSAWSPPAPREPHAQLPLDLRENPAAAYRAQAAAAGEPARAAEQARPWPALRPVGQIAATYLLAEGPDGLYVLDQHAAHERVFFEAFDRSPQAAQPLAVPQTVHLDALGRPVGWGDAVRSLGFDLEELDGGAVLVRAVPAGLTADALPDLLERLASDPSAAPETPAQRARRAMASCKAAIKANQRLSMPEIERLLADLAACDEPFACPHGRPTVLQITVRELEHHFRRI